MSNDQLSPRSNTVLGLAAKRNELIALQKRYRIALKRLTVDTGHLTAALRVFEAGHPPLPSPQHHRMLPPGQTKRFVLDALREAPAPMTYQALTDLWIERHKLDADAETNAILRRRITTAMWKAKGQGLVEERGWTDEEAGVNRSKLWAIRRDG